LATLAVAPSIRAADRAPEATGARSNSELSATDPAAADALFRLGRDAARRGDHAEACRRFAESYRLEPALGTRLNLGLCQAETGRLFESAVNLRAVLGELAKDDPRRALAEHTLTAIRGQIPRLRLTLPNPRPGLSIEHGTERIDPAALGRFTELGAGSHEFVVHAPGHRAARFVLDIANGDSKELVLSVGPLIPEDPEAAEQTLSDGGLAEEESSTTRTWGYALAGVGGAALVAAGVGGILILDNLNVVDEECTADKQCSPEGLAAGRRGRNLELFSISAAGVGVLAGSIGLYLLLNEDKKSPIAMGLGPLDGGLGWAIAGRY
jgi:hypothetical protein